MVTRRRRRRRRGKEKEEQEVEKVVRWGQRKGGGFGQKATKRKEGVKGQKL